jgi:hypothetical protein
MTPKSDIPKLRQYEELWRQIAKRSEPVHVTCAAGYAKRLIQAVRKEKSIANVRRKNFDMPRYGELEVTREDLPERKVRLTFQLKYNGDML